MDINDINALNKAIADLKSQLGDTSPGDIFEIKNLDQAQKRFKGLTYEVRLMNSELNYTFKSFQSIINEMTKGKTAIQNITKATNKLNNISAQLLDQKDGIYKTSVKELEKQKDISKIQFANLRREQEHLQTKKDGNHISDKENLYLTEINGILKENVGLESAFNRQLESALVKQKSIENSTGLMGALLKSLGQIPGLEAISKHLNVSEAVNEMENFNGELYDTLLNSDEIQKSGEVTKTLFANLPKAFQMQFTVKGIGLEQLEKDIENESINLEDLQEKLKGLDLDDPKQKKEIQKTNQERENSLKKLNTLAEKRANIEKGISKASGGFLGKLSTNIVGLSKSIKGIGKALQDPTVLFALLGKGMGTINKQSVDFSKALGTSYDESRKIRKEFLGVTNYSSDTFYNTVRLGKALSNYTSIFSAVGKINAENVQTFSLLNERVGTSVEATARLQRFAESFGKDLNDQTVLQAEITSQVGSQMGVQINQRSVLEKIGKASAYTLVQFKGSTEQLTEAVATAEALGTTLETVNKIAGNLLNFEQSITNELKAELLIGKNINLERARLAALNNDQITLMEEINTQIGTFSDFQNLNVIQQKAYADALGMSTNEMSDMLLMEQYRTMNAQSFAALNGEEALQRAAMLTTQEKFNNAILKMQDMFVMMVEGPLGKFAGFIGSIFENTLGTIGFFGVLTLSYLPKLIAGFKILRGLSIAKAIADIFAGNAALGPVGIGLAAVAVGGMLAAISSATADDAIAPVGYGNQGLMDFKKGELTLFNNQDKGVFVAGTDLSKNVEMPPIPESNTNTRNLELPLGLISLMKNQFSNQTPISQNTRGSNTNTGNLENPLNLISALSPNKIFTDLLKGIGFSPPDKSTQDIGEKNISNFSQNTYEQEIITTPPPSTPKNNINNSSLLISNNNEGIKELGNKFTFLTDQMDQLKSIFTKNNNLSQELIVATKDNKQSPDPLEPLYRKYEYS